MSAHIGDKLVRGSELSEADKRHVASCPTCQASLAAQRKFDDQLRTAAEPLASDPLPDRLLEEHLAAGHSILAWAPVAALVLLVAVVVGLGVSSGLPQVGPSQSLSASPVATSSSSPASSTSVAPSRAPAVDVRADLVPGPATCRNGTTGFSLWVPDGWYASRASADREACSLLAPATFEPTSGEANGEVAIGVLVTDTGLTAAERLLEYKEVLDRAEVKVGDLPAVRIVGRDGPGEHESYLIGLDGAGSVKLSKRFLVIRTLRGSPTFDRDAAALEEIVARFVRGTPLTTSAGVAAQADALFASTASCETDQYRLSYPSAWSVLSPGTCAAFGAGRMVDGADSAITIGIFDGAIGYLTPVIGVEDLVVAGHPATRQELEPEPAAWGPNGVGQTYQYVVQLGATSESGPNLVASTSTDRAGDYALNMAVLDRLMATLRIGSDEPKGLSLVSDPDLMGARLTVVAAAPGAIMAGGQLCTADTLSCQPAVWRSSDGLAWDPPRFLPKHGANALTAIASGNSGWIALGDQIWFSADGQAWTAATASLEPAGDGGPLYDGGSERGCCGIELRAALATPSGWVAVGGVTCFKCGTRGAVWLSSDGRSWERVRYTPAFEGSVMSSITRLHGGRLVAAGGQNVWTSDDGGHTWSVHKVFPAEESVSVTATEDGRGLLAISSNSFADDAKLWISTDGQTWTAAPLAGLTNSSANALVEIDGVRYVAVTDWTNVPASVQRLFRITGEGGLEPVTVEGGAAARIAAFAAVPDGLIAVGNIVGDAPTTEPPPPGVWFGR
jgi:hypothetical protein